MLFDRDIRRIAPTRRVPALLRCVLLASCLTHARCGPAIIPPTAPADPATVGVVDYGRHSSILLPAPENEVVEYAYGEWSWYAMNRTDLSDAIRAAVVPTRGALGRCRHSAEVLSGRADTLSNGGRVQRLQASRRAIARLRRRLEKRFETADNRHRNPRHGLTLVPHPRAYHAFHHCNTVTARWLRHLGCEVRGIAMDCEFRVKK